MNLIDRIKEHWLGGISLFAILCISGTWYVSYELFVKPRDFEIQRQANQISELKEQTEKLKQAKVLKPKDEANPIVLEPTWVKNDRPIPALSGQILITPISLGYYPSLGVFRIICPGQDAIQIKAYVGEIKEFEYNGSIYLFYLLETDKIGTYSSDVRAKVSIAKKQQ